MLGAGMYLDVDGRLWTLPGLIRVKCKIFSNLDLNYNYPPVAGDSLVSLKGAECVAFGKNHLLDRCIPSVQTIAVVLQVCAHDPTQSQISTPAAFEHRIAGIVIDDDRLSSAWKDNLRTLSFQIKGMRQAL